MKISNVKKFFISALSIIIISGFVNFTTDAAEVNPEAIERDKGYREYHDPVTVKIIEPVQNAVRTDATAITYGFERSIAEIDQEYDTSYGKKVSGIINDHSIRTVEIYKNDYDVLNKFSDIFAECYSSKEMPDLSEIYNLGNTSRKENMLLMQSWMYQLSVAQTSGIISCKGEVKVKQVDRIDENVREIIFRLEQKIVDGGHDQFSGIWFIADIATDEGGSRIINMWAEDVVFLMMRDRIERALLKYGDTIAEDIKNEIFNDCAQNKATMLDTKPISDPEDGDDLSNNVRARTTLNYDRDTVAEVALIYAESPNPLFYYYSIAEGGDCTNFISQSICTRNIFLV